MESKLGRINTITMDIEEYFSEYPLQDEYHRKNILGYFSKIIQELDTDVAIGVMENFGKIGKDIALGIKINYGY
jgi:hypothetical protein